jgi:hypothetical protein
MRALEPEGRPNLTVFISGDSDTRLETALLDDEPADALLDTDLSQRTACGFLGLLGVMRHEPGEISTEGVHGDSLDDRWDATQCTDS